MPVPESRMGQRLSYRRYRSNRSADWVVLIPGAGAASVIWRRQIQVLRRTYNVLAIDLPGHGRSPHGTHSDVYSFESMAAQVVDVMDKEGVASAHLISMSLGGLIAETVALHYPERVRSLILGGGIAKLYWWAIYLMYIGWAASSFMPYMVLYRVFAWLIMPGSAHALTRRIFAAHAIRVGRQEFLRWYRMCTQVRIMLRRNAVRATSIPTLFVMGDADYVFSRYALDRARRRSDTSVVSVPNCGHVCSVERPDIFNQVMGAFLLDQRKAGGPR
jgi:pimeloyl-ACP methyl ester carboxylesterase